MPTYHSDQGLDSPLVRYMMSGAQMEAESQPVSTMGAGVQSDAQRARVGNKFMAVRERVTKEIAKRGLRVKKIKKDKEKKVGVARQDRYEMPAPPPVQLPEPAVPEGLESLLV